MRSPFETVAVVILAAGKGTRMKSDLPKVLHTIGKKPMVRYVVNTARAVAGENIIVVVGEQADKVEQALADYPFLAFARQARQLGTGHAVQCALSHISPAVEHVVVLNGDAPLISAATLFCLVDTHLSQSRDITILSTDLENPTNYGRVLLDDAQNLKAIVEEADATAEQKRIRMVNAGFYCIKKMLLGPLLDQVGTENAQGEIYLTDIIGIGRLKGLCMGIVFTKNFTEVMGVNTVDDLHRARSAADCGQAELS